MYSCLEDMFNADEELLKGLGSSRDRSAGGAEVQVVSPGAGPGGGETMDEGVGRDEVGDSSCRRSVGSLQVGSCAGRRSPALRGGFSGTSSCVPSPHHHAPKNWRMSPVRRQARRCWLISYL